MMIIERIFTKFLIMRFSKIFLFKLKLDLILFIYRSIFAINIVF